MLLRYVTVVCVGLLLTFGHVFAQDENPLIGQWIDPLPNGAAMITEFSADTVAFWAVSPGGAKSETNSAPVTITKQDNGAYSIAIKGQEDTPLIAMMVGANAMQLAYPGMASRRLMRREP